MIHLKQQLQNNNKVHSQSNKGKHEKASGRLDHWGAHSFDLYSSAGPTII